MLDRNLLDETIFSQGCLIVDRNVAPIIISRLTKTPGSDDFTYTKTRFPVMSGAVEGMINGLWPFMFEMSPNSEAFLSFIPQIEHFPG